MKKYSKIDYGHRPASYWADGDVLAALLRNVKGRERREMIRTCYEQGRLGERDEAFLQETLSEEERDQLGKIHPAFMGGEYLPDYAEGEAEIARIELASTTCDVVSIRARRRGKRIHYSIVDEYNTEFELARETSASPLTLAQLVDLIDGSAHPDIGYGLGLCYNEMNADAAGERESLRHFTRVSSEFYPQLSEHYEQVYDEWVAEGEEQEQDAEAETGSGADEEGVGRAD
jgi:hypothetical protein